jgi:hypothetical protein
MELKDQINSLENSLAMVCDQREEIQTLPFNLCPSRKGWR